MKSTFFRSRKIWCFLLALAVAILMQWFGKFTGDFPEFLKWALASIIAGLASQDVGNSLEKKK